LNAQIVVYNMMQPGVSWADCHKAAEGELIKVLIEIGMVIPRDKSVEELVEARLGAVFLPCGLGHFIGIDTHDVGGYLEGNPERSPLPGLKKLRTARVLEENMVLTVEPGLYFIDHLLDEALAEGSPLCQHLNPEKVQEYRGFGGVRLEDVVLVTNTGIINYTLCPRTINEVESVMAGGKWPPVKDEAPHLRRVRLTDPTPLPAPPSV
jgi:Xaa-Pro dipeptidase